MSTRDLASKRMKTGCPGLDAVLGGGLPPERVYLVHGEPGTGKTTLSFQFMLEGVRCGERVLYITLLQTKKELEDILSSHGWSFAGIEVLELPERVRQAAAAEQTLFNLEDVELNEATDAVLKAIEEVRPQRLVLDSASELALLVDSPYQIRRQILKIKMELNRIGCTALITAANIDTPELKPLETLVHGVIRLEMASGEIGQPRRRLTVTKMRGIAHDGGSQDMRIARGGLVIYPRLHPAKEHRKAPEWKVVASGNERLDLLLGGGLEEGTACLIMGTTGAGKSTLAGLYAQAAAERGDKSVIFCFDERPETFIRRSEGVGMRIGQFIDQGLVRLHQMNVGEISPGEFGERLRRVVEEEDAKIVVIDSLSGYIQAMPHERQLIVQLHEMLSYLGQRGVLTMMILALHGLSGSSDQHIDASYLADTVILMRHFEANGALHRCISVMKKRHGAHEKTIREVDIGASGIGVGKPLTQFSGVLTGVPRFIGGQEHLMESDAVGEDRVEAAAPGPGMKM